MKYIFNFLFILIITFSCAVDAAIESPTHFQLFQLTKLTAEDKDELHGSCLYKRNEELPDFVAEFVNKTTTEYEAFLSAHINPDDKIQSYLATLPGLISEVQTFQDDFMGIGYGGLQAPLLPAYNQELLRDVITEELKATAEGDLVFWRYDNCADPKDKMSPDTIVSYSAPGILAGYLQDGIVHFIPDADALGKNLSGGACTYFYTQHALNFSYIQTNEGFRERVNQAYTLIREHDQDVNLPELKEDMNYGATEKRLRDKHVEDALLVLSKVKIDHGEKIRRIIGVLSSCGSRSPGYKRFKNTQLIGLKVPGKSYGAESLQQLSDSNVLPMNNTVLPAEYALFGYGENFHPKIKKSDEGKYQDNMFVLRYFDENYRVTNGRQS